MAEGQKKAGVRLTPDQAAELLGARDDPEWFDLISLPVVGLRYRGEHAAVIVGEAHADDPVLLLREPSNPADSNAIMVRARSRDHTRAARVGYIPSECAAWLSKLLDNGHALRGHVEYANVREHQLTITLRMRTRAK